MVLNVERLCYCTHILFKTATCLLPYEKKQIFFSPFMFVGIAVEELLNSALSQGVGSECHTAIVKFKEDWGDVEVKRKRGG